MRATYIELVLRDGEYHQVESTREGEPGCMHLIDQRDTGVTYSQKDWRKALAEMNRQNCDRYKAAQEAAARADG